MIITVIGLVGCLCLGYLIGRWVSDGSLRSSVFGHVHCDGTHSHQDGSSCVKVTVTCPHCNRGVVVRLAPYGIVYATKELEEP